MKKINKIKNNRTMLVAGCCCIVCVIGFSCYKLGQRSKEKELQPSIDELVKRVKVLEEVAFK